MQYLGGKYSIRKPLSDLFNKEIKEKNIQTFVSPFCGSLWVEHLIKSPKIVCADKHPYLIELWKGLQNGYELPETISEETYKQLKDNSDIDKVLAGIVGFGCSFGGKWFGGWARDSRRSDDGYYKAAKKGCLKKIEPLKNAEFVCCDYTELQIPDGALVYCDPPYGKTTQYNKKLCGVFDTEAFWNWVRDLSKRCTVYVSEYNAPDDFVAVWEKVKTSDMRNTKGENFKQYEKLFTLKENINE